MWGGRAATTVDKALPGGSEDASDSALEEAQQDTEKEESASHYKEGIDGDESSLERCAQVLDYDNGILYIEADAWKAHIWAENKEEITKEQVKDNYLARPDGSKLEGVCTDDYTSYDSEIITYFYFTKPIATGEYDAVVEATDGKKIKYAKVIVKDKPTVVSVCLSDYDGDYRRFDNTGDYIHLVVEGVGLGNGRSAKPYLTISGNKVAETREVSFDGRGGGSYIYKLEKTAPDSDIWGKEQEMKIGFAEGLDDSLVSDTSVYWNPYLAKRYPFGNVYYDAKNNVTRFQFKPGLNLQGKKNVSLTLKKDGDPTVTAEGTGDIDGNGLLSIALKKDGEDFIPVEQMDKNSYWDWPEYNITCSDPEIDVTTWICRYDFKPQSFDNYGIEFPTDIVYSTDKSFNPKFTIGDDILKGSGDITAEVAGHNYKLTQSGDFYTAEISLGEGIEEGRHKIMLHQGDTVIGAVDLYSIKPGKFYQNHQAADYVDRSGRRAFIGLKSANIIKEYYDQRNERGIGEKIWREQELSLVITSPDGEELTYTDPAYDFDGKYLYAYITLPEKIKDYYGCYAYFRSKGELGASGKHPEKSYYEDGSTRGLPQAYWGNVHDIDIMNNLYKGRYYKDDKYFAVRSAENFSDYIKYPLTVSFTRIHETTPLKTLSIEKTAMEKFDENYYFFTEEDLEGLDPDQPYLITAYDSSSYAWSVEGYFTGADDRESYIYNKIDKIEILQGDPEIAVGEEFRLGYTSFPWDERVNDKDVSWTSSDESIVTVDKSGLVKGIDEGTASVTVAVGGKSDTVSVNVIKDPVPLTALTLSQNSLRLEPGESKAVGVIKTPEDTTDKVTFTSSDPAVASVDEAGVVTAKKIGSTTITAEGGSKEKLEAKCEVKVVKEFKLQRDNNHFANAKLNFFKTAEGNTYQFRSNEYLDRLKKLASVSSDEAVIADAIIDGWGGSCFGIAATMGLIQTGRLNVSDLTDSGVADYHSLSAPVNDDKLFDSINFYQTGQLMRAMRKNSDIVRVFKKEVRSDSSRLTAFLKRLVESTADDKPVIFSYSFKKGDGEASGHAILAVNSRKDEDNHRYIVTLYDENTANGHQGQETEGYTEMIIPEDYSSFDYTPVGMSFKLQDRYDYLEICYPESLPLFIDDDTVSNTGKLANGADDGVIISVPLKSEITLKNDQGQNVSIKQGEAGGDIPVRDLKYIFADDASRVQVQVDKSDNFTVSSDNMDLSLITGEKIMSLKGEGMDSANLSLKDDKVSISGNNYKFNVTISCKDSDSLISMEGTAAGDTTVSVEGDTMTASSTGGLADLTSTSYTGNESQKEKVEVAEDGKGASAKHTETISGSGMDPEAEVNADNELCLVKGQTARLNGAGWKISGSSKAISLSAKNGVTTITSKQASTEGVSITDGKETYKVYVSVPSAKINGNKSAKLVAGSTAEVKISGIPDSLLDKYNVAWTSAKTEVAVVAPSSGSTAVVTAVGKGSTNITAYVGGKAYNCKVTVTDDAKNIPKTAGASADLTLNPMQTVSLKYSSFTAKDAVWSSMDSLSMNTVEKDKKGNPTASGNGIIKIVNKNGKITAIGEGETTVKGTDKTGRTVILKITVKPLPANPVAYVRCGKAVTLKASKLNKKYTEWKVESGSEFIQELNNGKVKAAASLPSSPASECAEVSCKFKPYAYGKGFEYRYRVYVEDPSLITSDKGLSAGTKKGQYSLNLKKGEAFSLKDQYKGISRGVIWKSSKPSVAYIDENGVIHATRSGNAGSTNLTASVGGVALKVTVKVSE